MKKRKFADGGNIIGDGPEEQPGTAGPFPFPFPFSPGKTYPQPGENDESARSGLSTINQGAQTVGSALDRVSGSLSQASDAIGGGRGLGGLGPGPGNLSSGMTMKKGGKVKGYAKGGSVSSASRRGDGIAQRGKTKGRMV